MTRLSDLTTDPITPAALEAAVRKGDPTLCSVAVALRDSWAIHGQLRKDKVLAENAKVLSDTVLEQLGKVMGSKPENTLQDLTALLVYGKQMRQSSLLLFDSLAVLAAGANQDVTAAANSLDALIRAVEVPPVVAR